MIIAFLQNKFFYLIMIWMEDEIILIDKLVCKNFTGIGKLIDEDYKGYFKNKKIDGGGVKKILNGITYINDFILGKKEGRWKEETS